MESEKTDTDVNTEPRGYSSLMCGMLCVCMIYILCVKLCNTTYVDAIIKEVKEERAVVRWERLTHALTAPRQRAAKSKGRRCSKPRRKRLKGSRILVDGSRWSLSPDEYYVGVIRSRCKYVSHVTGKEIDGYEVHWLLDDVKECITYEEALRGVRDHDEWIKDEYSDDDGGGGVMTPVYNYAPQGA